LIAVAGKGPLHAALPKPGQRGFEQGLGMLLMARQAPRISDAAILLDRAVTDDLTPGVGVEAGGRIEVAGASAPQHLLRGGRFEFRQRTGRSVVNGRLRRFIARLKGPDGHSLPPKGESACPAARRPTKRP